MKNEFEFLSADGNSRVHVQEWIPEGEVKAVVQICHGMVEYIDRYDGFATYLNERGYYVTGNDHLGHGKTAHDKEDLGHFPEKLYSVGYSPPERNYREEISERSILYAWTQYGVFFAETVFDEQRRRAYGSSDHGNRRPAEASGVCRTETVSCDRTRQRLETSKPADR